MDEWTKRLLRADSGDPDVALYVIQDTLERVMDALKPLRGVPVGYLEAYIFWSWVSLHHYDAGWISLPESLEELERQVKRFYEDLMEVEDEKYTCSKCGK